MTIKFAIFTSSPIPFGGPSPIPTSPDNGLWSPLSCTLIYTPTTALVIDCPTTIFGTRDLADWIVATLPETCTLKYFLLTHAHGDHFFGVPVLQARFPGLTALASANVTAGSELQYEPSLFDNVWQPNFPTTPEGDGIPKEKVTYTVLPESNEIILDDHIIKVIDVGHGDTHAASFIHVPDLDLVVAGDTVYNKDCHQYLAEANDATKRQLWVDALDRIARFEPSIVVPGHTFTPSTTPDKKVALGMLEGTKEYIRSFEDELSRAESAKDLLDRMIARYSKRWNLWVLNFSCESSFANRK